MLEASSEDKILSGFSHMRIAFGWSGIATAMAIWVVKQAMEYQVLSQS